MTDNERMPAFRSRATLESWLDEFQHLGYPVDATARVLEQDGADGANTGLVALRLSNGQGAYIQPSAAGRWALTLEPHDASELSAAEISRLSAELATVSALCAFLQAKSSAQGAEGS